MESALEKCDPNTFYSFQSKALDKAAEAQTIVNYCTTSFVLCFAPLIIVAPFVVQNLDVLTRKIISMIVLSDTMKFISDIIIAQRNNEYKYHTQCYLAECSLVSIIQGSAPLWSVSWYNSIISNIPL